MTDAAARAACLSRAPRPYLGILFDCCGAYARAYRNRHETAYEAKCPRCFRAVNVRIESGGTSARFFRAS